MPPKKKKQNAEKSIEEIYKKKSLHEHILSLPDTYIGSIEMDCRDMWIYDLDKNKIILKEISYIPALYKIYDEILLNAKDHSVVDETCRNIEVWINKDNGEIKIRNDGNGIPVEIHKEHKIYIPELIFGNLLTSSNYETKKKIVGGKNGYGAKLTNIYSKVFIIDTVDKNVNKKYHQKFYNNMYNKDKPIIEDTKEKPYTQITFIPDFEKFGIKNLTNEMVSLFYKRVYDIAICTHKTVKVYLNDKLIKVNSFKDYINMYYDKLPSDLIYEEFNERWKVGVLYDPRAGFTHMSFVNGIWTFKGGSHVNHVAEQITKKLIETIKAKHKDLNIKASQVKDNLTLFIDCIIEDPTFESQTKELMTTKVVEFGSRCDVTESFIEKIGKTGIIDMVIELAKTKEQTLLKSTDGKKTKSLKGLEKLHDASWAGTSKSDQCRLILVEGDSAKPFAVAGCEVVGSERFGIFPLRGKFINVRDATAKQLLINEEFTNLKRILGLQQGKKYNTIKSLRYGGIIILTDADVDGIHIRGLLINMLHAFWPSLLKYHDFISTLATPIVKAFKKNKEPITFYTMNEYHEWIKKEQKGYTIKYYKGLGTSTANEAKEAFTDLEKKLIHYIWEFPESDEKLDDKLKEEDSETSQENEDYKDLSSKSYEAITLGFDKKKANARKTWLYNYDPENVLEGEDKEVTYSDFINKDLIQYSNDDNIRSIPSLCDGFKPSQRKIFYASRKKKIENEEIKVAQLAGYISEHTEYHHGETSLQEAIVGMAQDFPGSNNINLLTPNGQFGTREQNGQNAASSRYIYTQLNSLAKYIFRPEDDEVYNYIIEEGKSIEPEYYAPIIPMVLVNSVEGIGTGFSTYIPSFNPKDIIKNIRHLLNEEEPEEIAPWYNGFGGTIKKAEELKYTMRGVYEIIDSSTIRITEIPLDISFLKYRTYLETLTDDEKQILKSYTCNIGLNNVEFTLKLSTNGLQQLVKKNSLDKTLKISSSINLTNMHLYNEKNKIIKYESIEDIITDFYKFRYHMYEKRKDYMIRKLENDLKLLTYKMKFIQNVIDEKIIINKKKKNEILEKLKEFNFPELNRNIDVNQVSYEYITDLPLFSLTEDKINELQEQINEKTKELEKYRDITIKKLWTNELDELEEKYDKWIIEINEIKKKGKIIRKQKEKKGKHKKN
jgi:DNA topoisomerase-2